MRSAVKSLLAALPVTMRLILKIQNAAQSARFLASSHAHSVPPAFSIFAEGGNFNQVLLLLQIVKFYNRKSLFFLGLGLRKNPIRKHIIAEIIKIASIRPQICLVE